MGLYYSGGYDWTYNGYVMHRPADAVLATPPSDEYRDYATAHVRELIDRYAPSVLWNDICWPGGGNLAELFAHYYNTVDDGVINDRWIESSTLRNTVADTVTGAVGDVMQAVWKFIPADKKTLTFPGAKHFDFTTPEYAKPESILEKKWESTHGVGHSFGANRNERPEDILTTTDLVRSFCDIISKNGNLLIGIGPGPDGVIPEEQQIPVARPRRVDEGQLAGGARHAALDDPPDHHLRGHTGALHPGRRRDQRVPDRDTRTSHVLAPRHRGVEGRHHRDARGEGCDLALGRRRRADRDAAGPPAGLGDARAAATRRPAAHSLTGARG